MDDTMAEEEPTELHEKAKRLRNLCRIEGSSGHEREINEVSDILQSYPQVVNLLSSEDNQTPLHLAAIHNQAEILSILMRNGANPELLDYALDYTPLMYTINKQSLYCFDILLDNKVNVNTCGKNGYSALHVAVEHHSDDKMVTRLLDLGANVDKMDETHGQTPLHMAAKIGSPSVLQKLLDAKPKNINGVSNIKLTPLHLAAENGHRDCCDVLLKSGADGSVRNRQGETPLMIAVKNCFVKTCELLLKQDRETVNITNNNGQSPLIVAAVSKKHAATEVLQLLLEYKPNLHAITSNKDTSLHYAAKGGFADKCKILMKEGADCNMKNEQNMTPLHYATKKKFPTCVAAILKLSLYDDCDTASSAWGSDLVVIQEQDTINTENTADVNIKDNFGKAPIHYALEKGSQDCCRVLLKRRANVCLTDEENTTPLHLAAVNSLPECCNWILSKGAAVDAKNNQNKTALHLAASVNSRACCQVLVKKGAKVCVLDKNKMSPLHYAASIGSVECCEFLLKRMEKNCEFFPTGTTTPLHLAAKEDHLDCCKELILNAYTKKHLLKKDEEGKMPHNIAFDNRRDNTFCYLLQQAIEYGNSESQPKRKKSSGKTTTGTEFEFKPSLSYMLHTCIKDNRSKAVETIVRCPKWRDALSSEQDMSFTRNFNLLVENFPDMAKIVLDNCIEKRDGNKVYTFLFIEDTYYFACKPNEEDTPDGRIDRWTTQCVNKVGDLAIYVADIICARVAHGERIHGAATWIIRRLRKAMLLFLEKVVYPSDFTERETSVEDEGPSKGIPKWSPFGNDGNLKTGAVNKSTCKGSCIETHPLQCMVKNKQLDLLRHELCRRLLTYKWERYMYKLVYYLFILSAAFVGIMSLYVTLANDWVYVHQVHNITRESICERICSEGFVDQVHSNPDDIQCSRQECTHVPQILREGLVFLDIVRFLALISLVLNVSVGFHQLYKTNRRLKYFILPFITYISAFALLVDWTDCAEMTGVREEWQWICGVISVMLAWFDLIISLGLMPSFDLYLFKLNDLMVTMLKLATILVLQVFAFSVAFQMLLRDRFVFSNYPRTIMKILTMTMGDLSYDEHFSNEESPLHYPFLSNVLLMCFLGLMSVIMLNFVSNFSNNELDKAKQETNLLTLSCSATRTLGMESVFPNLQLRYARAWVVDRPEEQSSNSVIKHSEVTTRGSSSSDDQGGEDGPKTDCRCAGEDIKRMLEDMHLQMNELKCQVSSLCCTTKGTLKRK